MTQKRAKSGGGTTLKAATQKPLQVRMKSREEPEERGTARTLLEPGVNHAYVSVYALRHDWEARGINELRDEIDLQIGAVAKGDMGRPEALLVAQTISLDQIYGDLARLAYKNWNSLDVAERFLRLAFKAQSQSRATLETLGEMKNPRPTVIAKQANVSAGHQQVNNNLGPIDMGRAREIESTPNELLEVKYGERLDGYETVTARQVDSSVETVAQKHRTDNSGG